MASTTHMGCKTSTTPWHINCTCADMTVFVNIGGQGQVDTHAHVRAHTQMYTLCTYRKSPST